MAEQVLYETGRGVARITINRPHKRNAVTWEVVRSLRAAVERAAADDDVRVVVLTGAGDAAFCAGADLEGMGDGGGFAELHDARGELAGLFADLWGCGMPTIARVPGHALAGGFGLALACDLVVAAEEATFGAPEIGVGLWPYMITVPLVRSMAPKKALELMLTGRRLSAEDGERLGFVTRVVPLSELDDAVDELAAELASRSPVVMRLGRQSFYDTWDQAAATALPHLHAMLTLTNETDDAKEGIAAFREKRDPRWSGR